MNKIYEEYIAKGALLVSIQNYEQLFSFVFDALKFDAGNTDY